MTTQLVSRLTGGGSFEIAEAPIPEAGDDGIVVAVSSCGVCGSDLGILRSSASFAGKTLGHEFSGRVVSAGKAVRGISEGDRITANPMVDLIGLGRNPGAFAQYLRIPSPVLGRNVFKLPDEVDDDTGALVEPLTVGLHAVNRSGAKPGDKVAIFGAGPIGLCVLAALRARGLNDVLVIDPSEKRRGFARAIGASAVHNPAEGSSPEFVGEHFGSLPAQFGNQAIAQADIVFDCAGVQAVLYDALASLRYGGTQVMVAEPHGNVLPLADVLHRELSVIGAMAYVDEFEDAISLLASGALDLSPLVTHRFPLSRIGEAFAIQGNAEIAGKVLVQART